MKDATRAHLTGLVECIVPTRDGLFRLIGPVAPSEYAALLNLVTDSAGHSAPPPATPSAAPIVLNDALMSAAPVTRGCLCVDFGTAASKVGYEPGGDRFEPLAIGGEGDDPYWVKSAIAIDADGRMVFGRKAIEAAARDGAPLLKSFKSKLWGDPAVIDGLALAGGAARFSFADAIQANLAYLTQVSAHALQEQGRSRYVPRRYAMPFAYDEGRKHIRTLLGAMLGRAALLADSLGDELVDGVPADRMRAALDAVAGIDAPGWLLAEPRCVGEPVAAGAFALDAEAAPRTVYMIADVGAGTTDFCILCLKKRQDGEMEPIQIRDGALSVEVAGDAVDAALVDFLAEQIGEEHRARLSAEAGEWKEQLFSIGSGEDETLFRDIAGQDLEISRRDFLGSANWSGFVNRLRAAQAECFDGADRKYLQDYGTGDAIRIVFTGGGAALPLSDALAEGVSPGSVKVRRVAADGFPLDVRQRFADLEADLPRLAVALGGSRDLLPADYDRTNALTSLGITPPRVWKPLDKTHAGLDD